MKTARLTRTTSDDLGTFGKLVVGPYWWHSMELPWKDNERNVSCIPPGTYECHFTFSNTFGCKRYILGHVEGRDGIRIHPANFPSQIQGCIALGNRYAEKDGKKFIVDSEKAVEAMEILMDGEVFELIIQEGM